MSYVDRGYRNYIRNGDMSIIQRGTGSWVNPAGYTVDGWVVSGTGGTRTVYYNQMNPGLGSNQLSVNTTGQSLAGDHCFAMCVVEGARTLAGQTATLSFNARAVSGTPKIGIEFGQYFGTGGSPSVTTYTVVGAVTISNVLIRYSVVVALPSIAAKTLGTALNDHLQIIFWLSTGSTYNARASNIGIQTAQMAITDVQLEAGSAPTAFERIPKAVQWEWNRRYFQRWYQPPLRGIIGGASVGRMGMPLGTTMRTAPTATFSGALPIFDGAGTSTVSSFTTSYCTAQSMEFDAPTAAALTTGRPGIIYQNSTTANYIDLTAEL